jgi:hypothetical protein
MQDLTKFQGVTHVTQYNDITPWVARALTRDLEDPQLIQSYCTQYLDWIKNTQLNTIQGLGNLPYLSYSNGTTEAFDKFRIRHRERRLRVLPDEYQYHQLYLGAKPIDSFNSLDSNDCLIISSPYAATGNPHPMMDQILAVCNYLDIPVLIDAAYYGLCGGCEFNWDWPCVEVIAFSLSKSLGTSNYRVGLRFSRYDDDSLSSFSNDQYVNRLGAAIGMELMHNSSSDALYNAYRSQQLALCKEMDLEPSKSVIFGLDHKGLYPHPSRSDEYARLCLSRCLVPAELPSIV